MNIRPVTNSGPPPLAAASEVSASTPAPIAELPFDAGNTFTGSHRNEEWLKELGSKLAVPSGNEGQFAAACLRELTPWVL